MTFLDNSYMSEQWTATVYNESTGFSGTSRYWHRFLVYGTPLNTDYEEIGWLAPPTVFAGELIVPSGYFFGYLGHLRF